MNTQGKPPSPPWPWSAEVGQLDDDVATLHPQSARVRPHDLPDPHHDGQPHALSVGDGAMAAWVAAVREEVRDELRRADQKATTLLSLVGATLAGLVALTGRPLAPVSVVLVWVAAVPISGSVVLLLSAIWPRLTREDVVVPGTWLHAARVDSVAFLAACERHGPGVTARDTCLLAGIAAAKYRRVRHAVALLTTGLLILAAALVTAALVGSPA